MQDQDAPPEEEGETGGGVAVVREAGISRTGAMLMAGSTPRPWTTAIERRWVAAITVRARDASVPALRRVIRRQNRNLCPCARMPRRGFSALSTIYFSKLKFRRPRAS